MKSQGWWQTQWQSKGDLTPNTAVKAPTNIDSVESLQLRTWYNLPYDPGKGSACPLAQKNNLAAAPSLAKEMNAGRVVQQKAVAAASSSCSVQSPICPLVGSGCSTHSANSLFPFQDSPGDTREWQSLL